jgi:hypothetical protein
MVGRYHAGTWRQQAVFADFVVLLARRSGFAPWWWLGGGGLIANLEGLRDGKWQSWKRPLGFMLPQGS